MARHNRDGRGSDQRDYEYTISYQPDWLRQVKVTRLLPSGRQSTKTLFTNPQPPRRDPGRQVRTRIRSREQGLTFEVAVTDPEGVVKRVIVETGPAGSVAGNLGRQDIQFTIDHRV
jgi:hypothetical protein